MRARSLVGICILLASCQSVGGGNNEGNREYGGVAGYGVAQAPLQNGIVGELPTGRYRQPINLRPRPPQRLPQDDVCRSRLYAGLVGQHEGGIVFASLPGKARLVKPGYTEFDEGEMFADMRPEPRLVVVREYLSGQNIYTPAINTTRRDGVLGPIQEDRLTIELDREGYVRRVNCR